uniref:Orotate phosphoribosyltransferase n=1 Tax=uncultured bacterium pA1 TaxID=1776268 RepID=A0A0U3SZY2_9BACT|nr:phosphoribosyl transferase domain protein [uncultured bacterium pA1]
MNPYDPRDILEECGAVIDGSHFVYASGRHGKAYVNKDSVFLRPDRLSAICLRLALACSRSDAEVVVGPAVGGAIIAQLVAEHLRHWSQANRDVRAAFADKSADGGYVFARGYAEAINGRRVLVVEDILTTGGSCRKVVEAARAAGARVVGAGALVNRGGVTAEALGVPTLASLVALSFPTWDERACPLCATDIPVRTDLGKGKDFLKRKEQGMKPPYLAVDDLVGLIDEPNRSACLRLLADNRRLFETVQGSTNNHQAWPGGYVDHVTEIMNIALVDYRTWSAIRPLPFSLSDALLVVYLHDVEKPWKYELGDDGQLRHLPAFATKDDAHAFRAKKLAEYGIVLTPEQQNGMKYVEGEFDDYSNRRRAMGPLAAFCHRCDVASARIWHDHPAAEGDPWSGAGRVRTA